MKKLLDKHALEVYSVISGILGLFVYMDNPSPVFMGFYLLVVAVTGWMIAVITSNNR